MTLRNTHTDLFKYVFHSGSDKVFVANVSKVTTFNKHVHDSEWRLEANKATETHCDNPGTLACPNWEHCMHGWQRGCKRILLASPQGDWRRKTFMTPPHPMAKHHPARCDMSQSHTAWSSRRGSESPSVEVAVDVRRYAILELHARNDDNDDTST